MIAETISILKQQEDQLHTSLDNLRGDRKKLRDYRDCDKQLQQVIRKRRNLEAAAQFHDGMLVCKANSEEVGIVTETMISPGGHAEVWVNWFTFNAKNINLTVLRSLLTGAAGPDETQKFISLSFLRGTIPVVEQPELLKCLEYGDKKIVEPLNPTDHSLCTTNHSKKVASFFSASASLTTGNLFSAGGGDTAGSIAIGYKPLWAIEKDKYAAAVYRKRFPEVRLIEADVTTLTDEFVISLPTPDLLIFGSPCFVAGIQVLTVDGYKSIENVQVGELVLTHTGNWYPVTNIMCYFNQQVREIRTLGTHSLITTDNHPFYAIKRISQWNNPKRKYDFNFTCPEWTNASSLTTKHFVSQVLPPLVDDNHTIAFWKLVGLYLADSWRNRRKNRKLGSGRVLICSNKQQIDQVSKIIRDAGYCAYQAEELTVVKFYITNNAFYQFLEQFRHRAEGKKLPGWVLGLEQLKAKALIEGYVFGDGWINASGCYQITTVSIALAYSIALLAQFDCENLRVSYLKMSPDSSPVTTESILNKSSAPSLNWGTWGLGSVGMGNNGSPKTDSESFFGY